MSNSLLFQFVRQLRQQEFPLGASDYMLVLEAVRAGLGLEDLEQFKRLLQLLWAKSPEEQKLLDREFDKWMKPHLSPAAKYSDKEKLEEDIEEFKLLCRLRWAKSPEERELFEGAFAELVEPQLQAIAPLEQSKITYEAEEQSLQQQEKAARNPQSPLPPRTSPYFC